MLVRDLLTASDHYRFMRPCTPHYVLTRRPTMVIGKHFFSSSTVMDSCYGAVHTLMGNNILTNTAHPETLHCLVALLDWWIDLKKHSERIRGLDSE